MCGHCGCASDSEIVITDMQTRRHVHLRPEGHGHGSDTRHAHGHAHEHPNDGPSVITLEHDLLAKNSRLAGANRAWLAARGIRAWNIMSSPGAGKTTLLESTIRQIGREVAIAVIEGDQATTRDGQRIRDAGCDAIQVNTGAACHLDAEMIGHALRELNTSSGSLVLIENVGNLVCPAMFDLGQEANVVVASVTEGDDKPAKYPHMFRAADLIVLNKLDLLPYVDFQTGAFERSARDLNPDVRILPVSATRGDGLDAWFDSLKRGLGAER